MPSIILTRSDEENSRSAHHFRAHGLTVFSAPMIELRTVPVTADRFDALRRITHETSVLITSSFACRLWLRLRHDELPDLKLNGYYVVGQRSAALLREADPLVPVCTLVNRADDLLHQPLEGVTQIVYPCSLMRRDETVDGLTARDIEVLELPLYAPVRPEASHQTLSKLLAGAEPPIALCFFSPSAVENFFSLSSDLPADTIFSAIGPTTAESLKEHGVMEIIMPEVPDAAALAAVVAARVGMI